MFNKLQQIWILFKLLQIIKLKFKNRNKVLNYKTSKELKKAKQIVIFKDSNNNNNQNYNLKIQHNNSYHNNSSNNSYKIQKKER